MTAALPQGALHGKVAGGSARRAVVTVGGDRPLGDAHLVYLVGTVGKPRPTGMLIHGGEWSVGRIAQRAVDL